MAAVILAAGRSSRMGRFKPLLTIGGQTLLERAISLFASCGIDDIRAVVGHCREQVEPVLEQAGIPTIVNTIDHCDMFSSVRLAIEDMGPDIGALILLPVDIPLVRPWTVQCLLDQHARNPASILVPSFQGKKGHPVVIPARYFDPVRKCDGENGLRGALKPLASKTLTLPVPDANILFDMDTPADYEHMKQMGPRMHIPTAAECESILRDIMGVSEDVYAHCQAVANAAGTLSDALNSSGCVIDRDLVVAAGCLHDMAKGQPRHDRQAAAMLTDMGFPEVARIVAAHTDISCAAGAPPNEAEVLYLSDKCVQGADVVDPQERFQNAMERYGRDTESRQRIKKRLADANVIQKKVESATGRPLWRVLKGKSI